MLSKILGVITSDSSMQTASISSILDRTVADISTLIIMSTSTNYSTPDNGI